MRTLTILIFSSALLLPRAHAQATNETMLSCENAYNPIPSPDGKYIAYVRTGWDRERGSGGFGRSNLVSDVIAMDASGSLATRTPLCDEFLAGWTSDSKHVVCFRDGRYMVASLGAPMPEEKHLPTYGEPDGTERVSYAIGSGKVIWNRRLESGVSVIESTDGVIARHNGWLGELIATSPDGRYISVAGASTGSHIRIYDVELKKWTDLGEVEIHPNSDWDYIKPSWNPWFDDSSRLAFFTHSQSTFRRSPRRHTAHQYPSCS